MKEHIKNLFRVRMSRLEYIAGLSIVIGPIIFSVLEANLQLLRGSFSVAPLLLSILFLLPFIIIFCLLSTKNRTEYLYLLLLPVVFVQILNFLFGEIVGSTLAFLYAIIIVLLTISLHIRRLHDLGHSGFLVILLTIPLVNIGLIIYLLFFKGAEGSNKYGDPITSKTLLTNLLNLK